MCEEEDTTLAQVNAGILNYDTTTRVLTPDNRRGVLKVVVSPEEVFSLVWRPRIDDAPAPSDAPDFSLELKPPSKVEVSMIKGQRAVSVRVDGVKKAFFWIQETGDESQVAELINEINEAIATAIEMYSPEPPAEEPPKPQVQQQPPPPLYQQQHQGPMTTEEMTRIIQMVTSNMPAPKKDLNLEKVLLPGKVIDVLLDPRNEGILNELYQYMPESTRTPEGIRELIRSPQFYRDVKILEAMVKSGEAGPILADFRMNMSAQGPYGGMRKFLEELIRVSKKK